VSISDRRQRPVSVPANGTLTVNHRLIALRSGDLTPTTLRWVLRDERRDILLEEKAELTVRRRIYREKVTAGAVNKRAFATDFRVEEPTGPLRGELVLYGGAIDGIMAERARMVREPHGCFEQVSSTSYPNALAVRLLKEAPGDMYRSILTKAQGYLASGYKQLAKYEVAGGGFSLWGRSPARTDLTAYGLQQFADLREVYDGINPEMILRARRFLRRKFDKARFAAQPDRVYVMLALLRHGEDGLARELAKHKLAAENTDRPLYRTLVAHALLAAGDTLAARTQVQGLLPEMLVSGLRTRTGNPGLVPACLRNGLRLRPPRRSPAAKTGGSQAQKPLRFHSGYGAVPRGGCGDGPLPKIGELVACHR